MEAILNFIQQTGFYMIANGDWKVVIMILISFVLMYLGGPESGDIVYVLSEMNNQHHGDSLSTAMGEEHTSVSPIFVAAGPGFKSGVYTDRVIRQIDVAPTISALFGVRFPAQAEGAPAYQILDWEF